MSGNRKCTSTAAQFLCTVKSYSTGGEGGRGEAQLAMTHLFLEQIFREDLLRRQEVAKG